MTLVDTDQDGIDDLYDIDDDNDGIPDVMEQYCSNPTLANSTSGSGIYQDNIYWFNWTDSDFADGLQDGDTQTFTLPNGMVIVASISNVVNLGNQGGERYVADDINTWSGARMHYLYNTDGNAEVFHSGGSTGDDVSFDISFTATHYGLSKNLDYILVDGESTNGKGEFITLSTDGGNWTVLEHYGSGAVYTGGGTQNLSITNTESSGVGNTVFYSENSQNFSISLNNHGGQAIGFGIYLECDSDNDGIFNHLDLDSDNDGIPDIVEAGGADVDGDGRVDNPTDSDNDGLADVFETAHGSSSILFDVDGDGVNEFTGDFDGDQKANWIDLDSDGDGLADVVEVGGTDADFNSLVDGISIDVDADGFADAVDGDVGNNNVAENSANALLLTSADADLDGQPDLGYSTGNTDTNGQADFLDIDADDDGIVDNTEAQKTNSYIAPSGLDSDGDGLDNAYDANDATYGGTALVPENTDGAGNPDFQDLDSDEDNLPDAIEGHDLDGDFVSDAGSPSNLGSSLGLDIDEDGLDDGYDNNTASTDPTNSGLQPSSHPNFYNNGDQDWRSLQTLAITYSDFQASWKGPHVLLSWKLSQSVQLKHIHVLRKTHTRELFQAIGQTPINKDSLYQFKDSLLSGASRKRKIFYQLMWIDINGKIHHSKTIELKPQDQQFDIKAYYVPGSDYLTLRSKKSTLGKAHVQVFNLKGDLVYQFLTMQSNKSSLKVPIGLLPKEIYILHVRSELGQKSIKLRLGK